MKTDGAPTLSTAVNLLRYVARGLSRNKARSALTIVGIATAMFLFCFIEGLQKGVREATESEATRNRLVVYQKSRFCPATSAIPQRYAAAIAALPGVTGVLPVKIFVNNCRASLDSVTFRGVPPDMVAEAGAGAPSGKPGALAAVELTHGSLADFRARKDGALVGAGLSARRGLFPGSRFQIGGLAVGVAGVFRSSNPGEENQAYVHLDFLQRAKGLGAKAIGTVTQFEVTVADAARADDTAAAIDALFKSDETQTSTKSHKAFVNAATGDLLGLVRFTRWLGLMCVATVLALTANTVFMMVQDRVKEHAVLQTLGFTGPWLFAMVVAESLALSLAGGALGTAAAAAALKFGHLGLGAEGVQIAFILTPGVVAAGLAASAATGVLAGVVPAIRAATAPIVDSLRRA